MGVTSGEQLYTKVFGYEPDPDRTGLREFTINHLYAQIWSRPLLDLKQRSLITVAILAATGMHAELRKHVSGAMNLGWSREELIEVMIQVAHYAGWPAGHSGQAIVLQVTGGAAKE